MTVASMVGTLLAGLLAGALGVEFAKPERAARGWLWLARTLARVRQRETTVAKAAVHYLDGGHGEPLVLLHGFGADKDNFVRIAPFLTPHVRIIAPDLAGFGDSLRNEGDDYRIPAQVERLREFVHALGLNRIHLGGSSMGGFIAAEFAARYPGRVASLWLLAPAGTAAAVDNAIGLEYARSGRTPLLVRAPADYADLLSAVMSRPVLLPRSLRRTLATRAAADFPLHERILGQVRFESAFLEPLLPAITAPTLIIWGAEDQVLAPAAAVEFQRLIAVSELDLMQQVGHLPMIERPRACAQRYLRFRARVGGAL